MKIKLGLFAFVVVFFISTASPASTEVATSYQVSGETPAEEVAEFVDYLKKGTLYNYSIHHSRPAKAISEKPKERKYKTFAENLSYSVISDFSSKYMYEGMALSRGWVWQPSASIEAYGFGFNVWGNFVMDNIPDQGKFNEVDLTIYYNYNYKWLNVQPFFAGCLYPTDNKISLDYSAHTDLKPGIHVAVTLGPIDIYTDMEVYVHPTPGALILDLGLGFQRQLVKRVGVSTAAQITFGNSKYNSSQYGVNDTKFQNFTYQLSLPVNVVRGFVIEPNINIVAFFSRQLLNTIDGQVMLWGGVNLTYNF